MFIFNNKRSVKREVNRRGKKYERKTLLVNQSLDDVGIECIIYFIEQQQIYGGFCDGIEDRKIRERFDFFFNRCFNAKSEFPE